jgi:phosphoribosyl-ATP pyrophosphohydrolase
MKLDYEKMDGLVPTILQEKNRKIIGLIYSNKESLAKTFKTKKVWRFSREQNKVIMKGATSKNTQDFISARKDCDSDALLMTIKQNGEGGCHKGTYTCFSEKKEFKLSDLYDEIIEKQKSNDKNSFTKKLLENPLLLKRKLIEETGEVITAKDKENLIWECSDLIYFLFVIMASEGVKIEDIEKENFKRKKEVKK